MRDSMTASGAAVFRSVPPALVGLRVSSGQSWQVVSLVQLADAARMLRRRFGPRVALDELSIEFLIGLATRSSIRDTASSAATLEQLRRQLAAARARQLASEASAPTGGAQAAARKALEKAIAQLEAMIEQAKAALDFATVATLMLALADLLAQLAALG